MTEGNEACLLVVLRPEVVLALAPQCPSDHFMLGGTRYEDLGQGDFLGFYDWLRDSEKRVIGVRHNIFDEFNFPYDAVFNLPYVLVDLKTKSIEMYFSDCRNIEESFSDDQCFSSNRMYKSNNGEVALSFYADRLIYELSPSVTIHALTL